MNNPNSRSLAPLAARYFSFFMLWDALVLGYDAQAAVYTALAWTAIFTGLFWRKVGLPPGSSD